MNILNIYQQSERAKQYISLCLIRKEISNFNHGKKVINILTWSLVTYIHKTHEIQNMNELDSI